MDNLPLDNAPSYGRLASDYIEMAAQLEAIRNIAKGKIPDYIFKKQPDQPPQMIDDNFKNIVDKIKLSEITNLIDLHNEIHKYQPHAPNCKDMIHVDVIRESFEKIYDVFETDEETIKRMQEKQRERENV